MLLLLFVTYISAQTFDLGEGRKATLDQAGNYKVTWNQKTDNGGTVVGTFTGIIKDGKRNGSWVGRITYTNFYMTNGNALSGSTTITRNYTDGKVNGAYTYNHNTNVKTCKYDIFNKRWVYGQPQAFQESVTGGFKDGQPHGNFNCSRSTFSEKITMSFDTGVPSGNWSIQNQGITTIGFKNGLVIQNKFMDANGSGEELVYASTEDIESLPNRQTVLVTDAIPYFTHYLQGGEFTNWFDQYPKNSSEEDFSKISWILVDYDNHLQLIGNVTQAQKDALENRKRQAKENVEKAKKEARRLKAMELVKDFPHYRGNELYDRKYYELLYWEKMVKENPGIKEYADVNNKIAAGISTLMDKEKIISAKNKIDSEINTLANTYYLNDLSKQEIIDIWRKQGTYGFKDLLYTHVKKYITNAVNESTITNDDIVAYMLYKNHIVYYTNAITIKDKKLIVTKDEIIKFKINMLVSHVIDNKKSIDSFKYNDYVYGNYSYNGPMNDYAKYKSFMKFLYKIKTAL